MLDPVIEWFGRLFASLGRGFGMVVAALAWPFVAAVRWFRGKGGALRAVVGGLVALFVVANLYFAWQTQVWRGFDPDYADAYAAAVPGVSAGEQLASGGDASSATTCAPSRIVEATRDLITFSVDENAWVPSMLMYKLGFFGIDWENTPYFDNKASFQRGVLSVLRRTTLELRDVLGRERGTSSVDTDLQNAAGQMNFDDETWYFGLDPFGPKTPTPSFYRRGARYLNSFNERLVSCDATFDPRADNLVNVLDRIAKDIGDTSQSIRRRAELSNAGWLDVRADNEFWVSLGKLYGYYGVVRAARADFADVIATRRIDNLWDRLEEQMRTALDLSPLIVSNGDEDGFVMPTHLTTMGFYVLRVRENMVEIRSVLDR